MNYLLAIICSSPARDLERLLLKLSKMPAMTNTEIWVVLDNQPASLRTEHPRLKHPSVRFFSTPLKYGTGGCSKVILRMAIQEKFDALSIVRTDQKADFEDLINLSRSFDEHPKADLLLARGKWAFNLNALIGAPHYLILNKISGFPLLNCMTPIKILRVSTLKNVAFDLNTQGHHFDMELLLQLFDRKCGVEQSSLMCHGRWNFGRSGLGYLWNSLKACLKYRLQKFSFFFDLRFNPDMMTDNAFPKSEYRQKFESDSPHSTLMKDDAILPAKTRVLDLGCASGYIAKALSDHKKCAVTGVDILPVEGMKEAGFRYEQMDLDRDDRRLADLLQKERYDVILMMDILEHLSCPERMLLHISKIAYPSPPKFIASTGNVAFFVIRMMLLMGFFNYGKKGILDLTHKRLFTLRTFSNLMEQTGFIITRKVFYPLPFRSLGFSDKTGRFLEFLNRLLIQLSPSLFSYQILFEARAVQGLSLRDISTNSKQFV